METLLDIGSFGLEESIEFAIMDSDEGDGYDRSASFGSPLGLREWKLTYKTLPQHALTAFTYRGKKYNRADYLWEFFCNRKAEGNSSFIIKSPKNGQSYLAKFADHKISYQLFQAKLWSTGVTIRQRRERGITVLNPTAFENCVGWYTIDSYNAQTGIWTDLSGKNNHLTVFNDGQQNPAVITDNNIASIRFDSLSKTLRHTANVAIRHAFVLHRFDGVNFSTFNGLLTENAADISIFTGEAGTNKFLNWQFQNYEFRRNGALLEAANQRAGMNEWAIANGNLSNEKSIGLRGLNVGQDRNYSDRKFFGNVREILLFAGDLSESDVLEINQYLLTKIKYPNGLVIRSTTPGENPTSSAPVLSLSSVSSNTVNLAWSGKQTNYQIERDGTIIHSNLPTKSLTDSNRTASTNYSYRARGILPNSQFTPWSNTVTAQTSATPSTPTTALPSTIVSDLRYWAKISELTAPNGEPIAEIISKTAGSLALTQNTTAAKPTIQSGTVGTKSNARFIRFDGDDLMQTVSTARKSPSGLAFYAVFRVVSRVAYHAYTVEFGNFLIQCQDSARFYLNFPNQGNTDVQENTGSQQNQWILFSAFFDANAQKLDQIQIDSSQRLIVPQQGTNGAALSSPFVFKIGQNMNFDIAELIFDDQNHSAQQRASIIDYLRGEYGFTN